MRVRGREEGKGGNMMERREEVRKGRLRPLKFKYGYALAAT